MTHSDNQQLTFWSEEHPANPSAWLAFEEDLLTHEETLCSPFSHWLTQKSQGGLSGKMSPVCCQVTEEGILAPSSGRWGSSGMGSLIGFLTLNTSEGQEQCLNGEGECLLSDTLETGDLTATELVELFYDLALAATYIDNNVIDAMRTVADNNDRRGRNMP